MPSVDTNLANRLQSWTARNSVPLAELSQAQLANVATELKVPLASVLATRESLLQRAHSATENAGNASAALRAHSSGAGASHGGRALSGSPVMARFDAAPSRTADAVLDFHVKDGDWAETVQRQGGGARMRAGTDVQLRVAAERFPSMPAGSNVTAFVQAASGEVTEYPLRAAGGTYQGTVKLPTDGDHVNVWLKSEHAGSESWDSNMGANYRFPLLSRPSTEPHPVVAARAELSAQNGARMKKETLAEMKKVGLTAKDYDRLRENIRSTMRVEIRMQPDALRGILADGRFRAAHEVSGKEAQYLKELKQNQDLMTIPQSTIYGAMMYDDAPGLTRGDAWGNAAIRWGGVKVVLDMERLLNRSTFTSEDSFQYRMDMRKAEANMTTAEHASDLALHTYFVQRKAWYQEAQMMGGVTTSDIRKVVIPPYPQFDSLAASIPAEIEVVRG